MYLSSSLRSSFLDLYELTFTEVSELMQDFVAQQQDQRRLIEQARRRHS